MVLRRSLLAVILLAALGSPALARTEVSAGRLQRLVELLGDRDLKVRIQAALALGQLRDRRVVPSLIGALRDGHPLVRAMAAHALGRIGDDRAVFPLRERLKDRDALVRKRAQVALDEIRKLGVRAPLPVSRSKVVVLRLGGMGDRTRRGGALLPELRRLWVSHIQRSPGLRLGDATPPPSGSRVYEVNSSITELSQRSSGQLTETTCNVSVILGDGKGSIVMMTSGGATVQVQSRGNLPRSSVVALQTSALETAVATAHSNVIKFLAAR
jgi:hypothetical protein